MKKYKINPSVAFRKINDTIFIVDVKNSYLHKLNEVGSLIWDCISLDLSEEKIIEKIVEEYDVPFEVAKKDFVEFITELKNKKLIYEE